MNKRSRSKKNQDRKSTGYIVGAWIGAALSLLLLVPTAGAIGVDIGSFRSCDVNSSDLSVASCGKSNVNGGDILILLLFLGSLSIVVCLFTHAWRSARLGHE